MSDAALNVKISPTSAKQGAGEIRRALDEIKKSSTASMKEVANLKKELDKGKITQKDYAKAVNNAKKDLDKYSKSINSYARAQQKATKETLKSKSASKEAVSALSSLKAGYVAVAAVISGVFVNSMIKGAQSTDKISSRLRVALIDTKEAQKEYQRLRDVSNKYSVEFEALSTGASSFMVASRGKLELEEQRKIIDSMAMSVSALKLSGDEASGVFKALEQMMSKGTVQAEELKGQLGDRLPSALPMAAKALNVTEKELNKLLQRGEVLASDLLPKLAYEMEKTFGKEAKGAAGMQAEVNSFKNALSELYEELNKSPIGELIQAGVGGTTFIIKEISSFTKWLGSESPEEKAKTEIKEQKRLTQMTVNELDNYYQELLEHKKMVQMEAEKVPEFTMYGATEESVKTNKDYAQETLDEIQHNLYLVEEARRILSKTRGSLDVEMDNEAWEKYTKAGTKASEKLDKLGSTFGKFSREEELKQTLESIKKLKDQAIGFEYDADSVLRAETNISNELENINKNRLEKETKAQKEAEEERINLRSSFIDKYIKTKEDSFRLEAEGVEDLLKKEIITREQHSEALKDIEKRKNEWIAEERKKTNKDMVNNLGATVDEMKSMIESWGTKFTDTFMEMTKTGKFAFKDLVNSMLSDMARMAFQKKVSEPVMDAVMGMFKVPTKHTGGMVGGDGGSFKNVSVAAFANAPRMHTGGMVLGPDEVPIIAQRGESVLTPEQMKALGPGTVVQVIDQRTNSGSENVEVSRSKGRNGIEQVRILIKDTMKRAIGNGEFNDVFGTQFNMKQAVRG